MTHELWLVKGRTMTNITPLIGKINRRSNKDELGEELSFDIAFNDNKHFPKNPCEIGDLVIFKNGTREITRTIIVEETKSERNSISYTSFDFAFYLNKSNSIYQFNKMRADQCIKKVLKDFGIPIGRIVSIPTQTNKIFNDVVVSDIIREILEIAEKKRGTKYLMEMQQGKLYIEEQKNLSIKANFRLADQTHDITKSISNPTRTRSIQDMKNSIQIVGNDDKLVHTENDNKMIKQFGKLQQVVQLDQDEKRSAKTIARNELKELSRIVENGSIELLGDDNFRAGRILEVNEPITDLKGKYLIVEVDHMIAGGIHTMSLSLEGV